MIGLPTRRKFQNVYATLPSPDLFRKEYRLRCRRQYASLAALALMFQNNPERAEDVETIEFTGRIIGRRRTMVLFRILVQTYINVKSIISDNFGTAVPFGNTLVLAIAIHSHSLRYLHLYKAEAVSLIPQMFCSDWLVATLVENLDNLESIVVWNVDMEEAAELEQDLENGPLMLDELPYANPDLMVYVFGINRTHRTYVIASPFVEGEPPRHEDALLMSAPLM